MPALVPNTATDFTFIVESGGTLHTLNDAKYWKKGNCVAVTIAMTITPSGEYMYFKNLPLDICVGKQSETGQNEGWATFYPISFQMCPSANPNGAHYPGTLYVPGRNNNNVGKMIINTAPLVGQKIEFWGSMIYFV